MPGTIRTRVMQAREGERFRVALCSCVRAMARSPSYANSGTTITQEMVPRDPNRRPLTSTYGHMCSNSLKAIILKHPPAKRGNLRFTHIRTLNFATHTSRCTDTDSVVHTTVGMQGKNRTATDRVTVNRTEIQKYRMRGAKRRRRSRIEGLEAHLFALNELPCLLTCLCPNRFCGGRKGSINCDLEAILYYSGNDVRQ